MPMKRLLILVASLGLGAAPLAAQSPTPRSEALPRAPIARGPIANTAEFLLARTGALDLSDSQVLQLAELARATDARREQLRAELQAARPETLPAPGADRAELRERIQAVLEAERDDTQQERQAAIAILSEEQQTRAREMLATARGRATALRDRPSAPASPAPRRRAGPLRVPRAR